MRGLDDTFSQGDMGTVYLINIEEVHGKNTTDDIDYAIYSTNFMEVNSIDCRTMYTSFSLRKD